MGFVCHTLAFTLRRFIRFLLIPTLVMSSDIVIDIWVLIFYSSIIDCFQVPQLSELISGRVCHAGLYRKYLATANICILVKYIFINSFDLE